MKARLLSKSRFKIACECPTKLFFTGKSEYENTKLDDAFLKALADGGFQVGELAKLYHPDGIEIETLHTDDAIRQTDQLLKQENVTIYEAAFRFKNLLVRVDVLVKRGSNVELIEVKAKSFDKSEQDQFYNKSQLKRGITKISKDWEPYLLDVAFQKYVLKNTYPDFTVTAALMLADKKTTATVAGLNQLFLISKDSDGRTKVTISNKNMDLGAKILTKVSIDAEAEVLYGEKFFDDRSFEEYVVFLADSYEKDLMIPPNIGSQCKGCEFRTKEKKISPNLKSGFEHCWTKATGLTSQELSEPLVFEIWNYRKSNELIEQGRYFVQDIEEEDISPKENADAGLSQSERQWLQVKKIKEADKTAYFDHSGLANEMRRWTFPLHFIDFETSLVAIPFHEGRRPYEQIAFQFSHHVVSLDGTIEHKSQYISTNRGEFPNFNFIRELRRCLSTDNGTILRYATHENTVLCQIHRQLSESEEIDRKELMEWIESVTKSTSDCIKAWEGNRSMVDMCDLVKKFFYHPQTRGSNSIKKVLPAILQESKYLQDKYTQPIYGSSTAIGSLNFKNWRWIEFDENGEVKDPYQLLPPVYDDLSSEQLDTLLGEGALADGGAAMTAYARMQFSQMSKQETEFVVAALLKYCELDTFAMVLIYEYWKNTIESVNKKVA